MDIDDDDLRRSLSALDPAARETPPLPGSDRRRTILEEAMTTTPDTTPTTGRVPNAAWLVAAAVALVVAVAATITLAAPSPSAAAEVGGAAAALGEVDGVDGTLEVSSTQRTSVSRIRVRGDDLEISGRSDYADGHTEASTTVVVDGTAYETIDGRTTRSAVGPADLPAPFVEASVAVVSAVTRGEITEGAAAEIDGVETRRFDIRLDARSVARLAALPPNQLSWFELEYPESVDTISVWIADGLVRRIRIEHDDMTTVTTFTGFDGTGAIAVPPGPYVDAP